MGSAEANPPQSDRSCGAPTNDSVQLTIDTTCDYQRELHENHERQDVNEIMLRAIDPPDHSNLSLEATLQELKLNLSCKQAFKNLLNRVGMNVWTLRFHPQYEESYRVHLLDHAIKRIRYTMGVGFIFVLLKEFIELFQSTDKAWTISLAFHAYLVIPSIIAAFVATFVKELNRYSEYYASLPFLLFTLVLVMQKVLEQVRGPSFALYIVFIPVFGVTRIRFSSNMLLAGSMFLSYMVGVLVFHEVETTRDILFQGYNYLGSIVVGAVCHYREEVLRRRNFVMILPFADEPFDAGSIEHRLNDPRQRKHILMFWATLKFKHAIVEEAFYRNWYLIDASPFEHPNAGKLHYGVYRTVRFAVMGVIFSQILLACQDWNYLWHQDTGHSARVAYTVATSLRFGMIIPAYALTPLIMFFLGRKFYLKWREQASMESRGGVRSSQVSRSSFTDSTAPDYQEMMTPKAEAHQTELLTRDYLSSQDTVAFGNNYVRTLQRVSITVVALHALTSGIILLLVDQSVSPSNISAAPTYFLGFLNAILFPHRSGLRIRYIYASIGTALVSIAVVIIAVGVHSHHFVKYGIYTVLTNIFAMMISHEEETLRRVFFIRKAIRSQEFRRRYEAITVLRLQLIEFIHRRRLESHDRISLSSVEELPTIQQMREAGKFGMMVELGRAVFAVSTAIS